MRSLAFAFILATCFTAGSAQAGNVETLNTVMLDGPLSALDDLRIMPLMPAGLRAGALICSRIRSQAEMGDPAVHVSLEAGEQAYALNDVHCNFKTFGQQVSCQLPLVLSKTAERMVGTILRDGMFADISVAPVMSENADGATTYALDNVKCSFKNSDDAVSCAMTIPLSN